VDPGGNRTTFLQIIEAQTQIAGRFRQIQRLPPEGGSGNFSLIFQSSDSITKEPAILKFFNPEKYAETYRWESFKREAALLESLTNQNDIINQICPLSQVPVQLEIAGGMRLSYEFYFYALEVAVGDVSEVISGNLWSAEQNLSAFRSMCRAVQRLHNNEITHRDLKPDNFLILENGAVKLGDLGTACKVDGHTPHFLDSYFGPPGDLRYSAPELFACLHDDLPEIALRADFFSLGAILFELFTHIPLTLLLFDEPALTRLDNLRSVPARQRLAEFIHLIQALTASKPLPDLRVIVPTIPGSICVQLNALYRSMACLDYRERLCDFVRIFNQINQCLIILRNAEKFKHWKHAWWVRHHKPRTH
jgi:serine/threonine protein kinase